MNEKNERVLRHKAVRLKLQGFSVRAIGQRLQRGRSWVSKWTQRATEQGPNGLKSSSRRPQHSPQRFVEHVRQVIVRVRRTLEKRKVGRLIGARAIEREIRHERLLPEGEQPSQSTIKRILHERGLIQRPHVSAAVYFPQPTARAGYVLQAMDWTARYLEGGAKIYAFHSMDIESRIVAQTISDNKRGQTTEAHALKTWQILGLPDGCQIDNDALWRGSLKTARHLGRFMRLALYLGIELIFIPEAEPQRNGLIEWLNGLWAHTFWEQQRFHSVAHVQRSSPAFVDWYTKEYEPFTERIQTPAQIKRALPRRLLSARQMQSIPNALPITAGRIHFIRLIDQDGDIRLLHETWHVDKRLRGQYVWATLITQSRSLIISYRRAPHYPVRTVSVHHYDLAEPIALLRPEFKRRCRRRRLSTML
jgi:transposase